jgi:PTS system nitrogen regulatory IIA component
MQIANLLTTERMCLAGNAASKKKLLEQVAELLAPADDPSVSQKIYSGLLERERLGSTGLGFGVAIPHARIPGLKSASIAFLRLEEGVDYDAADNQAVDLIFALLVPLEATQEHLELLADLAKLLNEPGNRAQLRKASSKMAVRQYLKSLTDHHAIQDNNTGSTRLPA